MHHQDPSCGLLYKRTAGRMHEMRASDVYNQAGCPSITTSNSLDLHVCRSLLYTRASGTYLKPDLPVHPAFTLPTPAPCPSPGSFLLDTGVIQATERDEFAYQEMIAHLPMCALEVRSDDRGEGWAGGELNFQGKRVRGCKARAGCRGRQGEGRVHGEVWLQVSA